MGCSASECRHNKIGFQNAPYVRNCLHTENQHGKQREEVQHVYPAD